MTWFFIALIGPFFWSIGYQIDKHLLGKYFDDCSSDVLLMFSAFAGLLVLPFVFLFERNVFSVSIGEAAFLASSGFLFVLSLFFYLRALQLDDASVVTSLFQLNIFFTYIFGFLFLDEFLSGMQIMGSLILILGVVVMTLDFSESGNFFKKKILYLMIVASFFQSLDSLLFKIVALDTPFWISIFWQYLGFIIPGIGLLFFVRYRKPFLHILKVQKARILSINVLNEIINVFGKIAFSFASLLAPLAVVWVVSGFEPLFVFAIGIVLTIFFPRVINEDLSKKSLIQKFTAIIIMFVGTFLLTG